MVVLILRDVGSYGLRRIIVADLSTARRRPIGSMTWCKVQVMQLYSTPTAMFAMLSVRSSDFPRLRSTTRSRHRAATEALSRQLGGGARA